MTYTLHYTPLYNSHRCSAKLKATFIICIYIFRLTHDISIENFSAITDDYDTPSKQETDDTGDVVCDVIKLKKQLSDDANKNKYNSEQLDSNRLQELETGSVKTSICSKDSGNESDNNSENKLANQELDNKERDVTSLCENKPANRDDICDDQKVTSSVRSLELERVHERMKSLGLRKSFEELCKDQQAFIKEDDPMRKVLYAIQII